MEHQQPDELSPAERLDAVAEILARGVARVLAAPAAHAAASEDAQANDEGDQEAR